MKNDPAMEFAEWRHRWAEIAMAKLFDLMLDQVQNGGLLGKLI
jgi:hypothetical protein